MVILKKDIYQFNIYLPTKPLTTEEIQIYKDFLYVSGMAEVDFEPNKCIIHSVAE